MVSATENIEKQFIMEHYFANDKRMERVQAPDTSGNKTSEGR